MIREGFKCGVDVVEALGVCCDEGLVGFQGLEELLDEGGHALLLVGRDVG